jgi:predicted RNase H-like nuclease (RuvC/YqgF family)
VSYELDVAKRACEELIRQNHKALQDRESHWQAEYDKLERMFETLNQKLKRAEAERDRTLSDRREHDILRAKYATLEDKIKRQEAYMKSRFLKDKSNTLHVPDAMMFNSKSSTAPVAGAGGGAVATERLSVGGGSASSRSSRSHLMGVGPNQLPPSVQKNHEL